MHPAPCRLTIVNSIRSDARRGLVNYAEAPVRRAPQRKGLITGAFREWNTLLLPPFKQEGVVNNAGAQAFDVEA
jgi:hypothetical protein